MLSLADARTLLLPTLLSALPIPASGGAHPPSVQGTPAAQQEVGRALAVELGCGGCHAGAPGPETIRGRAPALGAGTTPLSADFVFTYLGDPVRRLDDIGASRMPDFHLDEGERVALALFVSKPKGSSSGRPSSDGPFAVARARHTELDAADGERTFAALGCSGCHVGVLSMAPGAAPTATPGAARVAAPTAAPDLSREGVRVRSGWMKTFLARPTAIRGDGHPTLGGARMPDFRLAPEEVDALAAWLGGQGARFATLDDAPLTPFEAMRTKRVLEDRLACLGCHRIGGEGGRIGPSLEGVATRLDPSFVLETILAPQRAAPGSPMPHQPLQLREASRLARYLVDLSGAWKPTALKSLTDATNPAWATATVQAPGDELYTRHCVACHGSAGQGDGWNASDLPVPPAAHADSARMSARVDDALFDGIYSGAWVLDGSPRMPAFGDLLSPTQIRTLVGYIRTLCGCTAPTWSRNDPSQGGERGAS